MDLAQHPFRAIFAALPEKHEIRNRRIPRGVDPVMAESDSGCCNSTENKKRNEIAIEDTTPGRYVFSESGRYRAERIALWIEEALAPMDIP
jgi:hypothetical protein